MGESEKVAKKDVDEHKMSGSLLLSSLKALFRARVTFFSSFILHRGTISMPGMNARAAESRLWHVL
jgi:hypothetical protein